MKKILLICMLLASLVSCVTHTTLKREYKDNRFTKQFQQADSMFNQKIFIKMKTLDEKAAEYAASVIAEFPELASYKGTIETVYGQGAMEGELLGKETGTFGQALESLRRGRLVARKG